MRLMIVENEREMSLCAARMVAETVVRNPTCNLGLATGSTPLGLYGELVRMHQEESLDFSAVTTFNLDEYVSLPGDHPQSYRRFMDENLFNHVNVDRDRTHVPNGCAEDLEEHCLLYEKMILDAGGIDLQLLGIGADGHIAFNEPGASLGGRTSVVALAQRTIEDNARFFASSDEVPRFAITMGVGTIMEARRCLLLACGAQKAEAARQALEGPICSACPASSLRLHDDATAIFDEQAARLLQRRGRHTNTADSRLNRAREEARA